MQGFSKQVFFSDAGLTWTLLLPSASGWNHRIVKAGKGL